MSRKSTVEEALTLYKLAFNVFLLEYQQALIDKISEGLHLEGSCIDQVRVIL